MKRLFTSESVTEGHPDKLCDCVSDAVLDAIIAQDPAARVACETCATTGIVLVMGEITAECYVDIASIVRDTVRDIGYDGGSAGFDYKSCAVLTSIDEQSPDIAMGVNSAYDSTDDLYDRQGAGDQGMMFGYACSETKTLMPAPIMYAHLLTKRLSEERKNGNMPFLRPDGKSQVSVEYDAAGKPKRFSSIVISTQHSPEIELSDLRKAVIDGIITPTLPKKFIDKKTDIYVNPTGRFVVGGPQGDSGLTGRKIIVDTYGGYACHGGGAFSGKDPTKVDRTAAYMARYAAKNMVAAGLCKRCEIQLAYAIGVARPVSISINSFGTGVCDDERLADIAREAFDFRPAAMIDFLDLRRPIYRQTAAYGHFGREDVQLPWEELGSVERLKNYR